MSNSGPSDEQLPEFIGNYRVLDCIGSGRYGRVYRVEDDKQGKEYALKLFQYMNKALQVPIRRFRREFQSIARLDHPHIIKVYDLGDYKQYMYFTMELIEGTNLSRFIDPEGIPGTPHELVFPDRVNRVFTCFEQILSALHYVHQHRIVHRDLKPDNIMVNGEGEIKLMDFGLAKNFNARSVLTTVGTVVGTLTHISPEQIKGREIDGRADLYSLGIILYEMFTGVLPFSVDNISELLVQHLNEIPRNPCELNPALDESLAAIIMRVLNKEPAFRYQTANEFQRALFATRMKLFDLSSKPIVTQESAMTATDDHRLLVPKLCARDYEIRVLTAAIDNLVHKKHNTFVLISGETGIGKTRIVSEIQGMCAMKNVVFLKGVAYKHVTFAYRIYLGIFEGLANIVDPGEIPEVHTVLNIAKSAGEPFDSPVSESQLKTGSSPQNPESGPEARDMFILRAVEVLLRIAAVKVPLVIVLDNLHWADARSLNMSLNLARNLVFAKPVQSDENNRVPPVCILGTYSTDEYLETPHFGRFLDALFDSGPIPAIRLGRFTGKEMEEFLRSMLGYGEIPEQVSAHVYRESEGNPLYAEEIIRSLVETKALCRQKDTWVLNTAELDNVKIPKKLRIRIENRLKLLDREQMNVVNTAAVMGREFNFELLMNVTGLKEEKLLGILDRLIRKRIFQEQDTRDDKLFMFYHDKIREVALDNIKNPVRKQRIRAKIQTAINSAKNR